MSQEEFENIEKYLNDSLEGSSLEQFKSRMAADPVFAKTVEKQRILQDAIQETSLRSALDGFHNTLMETESTSSGKVITFAPWMRYAGAACIALLLAWGGFTYLNGNSGGSQEKNEQLFAAHFTPDPGLPTTMSASDNYDFFNAMVSYKQGEYQKAISTWEVLLKEKPSNDTLNYFIGVAYLANNNEDEAISFLQWAAEYPESKFSKEVYHFLGLAYIKAGDENLAQVALQKSSLKESKALLEKLIKR